MTVTQLGVCRGWYHCIYVLCATDGFTLLLGVVFCGHCVWWVITLGGVKRFGVGRSVTGRHGSTQTEGGFLLSGATICVTNCLLSV